MKPGVSKGLIVAGLLLAVALGGAVGWWLAMRSMPMGEMGAMEGQPAGGMQGMAGMDRGAGGAEAGPGGGRGLVQVDPTRLQRIGVRYAVAEREALGRTVRAEAAVQYDEERKASVTTKIAGWVEKLYVEKPGQPVRRGQPLLEIYGPELVSTQRELILALEHAERSPASDSSAIPADGPMPGSGALPPNDLVESARRRLRLWDVPESEIERLVRTREVRRTLTLPAPASGVVVEKNVLEGARVEPGQDLFTLVDISSVWVEAHVFETDLADIHIGQPATMTLRAYPNEAFTGTVAFIYPYLDPATRTTTVRLEVPNPDGRLKPGMFATVSFDVSGDPEAVVVPSSAVIQTGERAFVLVKRGEGLFEPREVKVGARADERISIAENLAPGDTVVASANFLIDSEANLMAFMGGMIGMGMPPGQMRMQTEGMEGMQGPGGQDTTKGMEGMNGMGGMEGMEHEDGKER